MKGLVNMAGLKLITGPATEPVTVSELKTHLRIDSTTEDTYLGTLIQTAREDCEQFQNRAYITQTWELTLDGWAKFPIKLPRPELISITSVKYYDTADTETTYSTDNYFVDTSSEVGRIGLNYNITLPSTTLRPQNAVIIQYIAGFGAAADVPQRIKHAILMLCGHYYENRETVSPVDLKQIPMGVVSLLNKDRIVPI